MQVLISLYHQSINQPNIILYLTCDCLEKLKQNNHKL